MSEIEIITADLENAEHGQMVLKLVDAMSHDAPAGSGALDPQVRSRLIPGMQAMPTTLILLAMRQEEPLGGAICFWGFSTFAAQPLINLHDLIVHRDHRGQGVGRRLMAGLEEYGRANGALKITLEVDEANAGARRLYAELGYIGADVPAAAGRTFSLQKKLSPTTEDR